MQLKEFLKKYGTNTTTNFDLIKIAQELNLEPFYYVMRDEIKNLPQTKPIIYVCTNLHKSNQQGIHHSCFTLNNPSSKNFPSKNFFFDSYGLPPTNEVKNILGHGTANTFQVQTPGTKLCGQLSLFVLHQLNQGKPFLEILLELVEYFQGK